VTSPLLLASLLALAGFIACADNKTLNGHEYETYGLFNKDEIRDTSVVYSLVWGNVIWGAVLFQTIACPIYFYGFSLWEPKRMKPDPTPRD